MQSSKKITGAIVALAVVTGGLVASCSSASSHSSVASTSSSTANLADARSTPTPTPTPVAPPSVGATLDTTAAAALPDGWKAYPMADGTKVAVSATAPLPEPVRAQAIAPITDVVRSLPHGAASTQEQINAVGGIEATVDRAAYAIGQATGKRVVVVYNSHGGVPALDNHMGTIWESSARGAIDTVATYSRDTAVKASQDWIAKQANPANYELFVVSW